MRFAIAASILVSQIVLPTVTEAPNPTNTLDDWNKKNGGQIRGQRGSNNNDEYGESDILNFGTPGGGRHYRSMKKKKTMMNYNKDGRLMNQKFPFMTAQTIEIDFSDESNNKECNPSPNMISSKKKKKKTTPLSQQEADIGILECDEKEYCMESEYSKLGGYCIKEFSYETFQQQQEEELEQWDDDEQQYQRELSFPRRRCRFNPIYDRLCYTPEHCLPGCGNETCFTTYEKYTIGFDYDLYIYNNTQHRCFEFTEPFETSMCFTRIGSFRPNCTMEYDGTTCDSCFVNRRTYCLYFDCRNVQTPYGQGSIGSTCDAYGTCNVYDSFLDTRSLDIFFCLFVCFVLSCS